MTFNFALTTASGFQINIEALTMETNEQAEKLAPEMEMKYNFFFLDQHFLKSISWNRRNICFLLSLPYTGEIQLMSPLPRRFKSVVLIRSAMRSPC